MDVTNESNAQSVDPTQWVDQYGDFLYRYAMSRLHGAEAAEEVVQETFVAGLRATEQYSGKGAERAWLLGILKRKIVDFIRARNRTGSIDAADQADEFCESLFDERGMWRKDRTLFGSSPSSSLERQELWQAFRDCLTGLPQKIADVFTLRELDGKNSEEICKDLDISASYLWVMLHRARLRLAHCMKTKWQDEGEKTA